MRDVLVVCPQERDPPEGRLDGFRVVHAGPDLDAVDVDSEELLEELGAIPADGVVGTKDRSALVAALLAERRGLVGPPPSAILACQHKPTSRDVQRRVAPGSTPRSTLLDGPPPFPPPWFVKPVVGRLSQEARRVDDVIGLAALAENPEYRDGYAGIARLAGLEPGLERGFLVEELVQGDEVTLEGYVCRGRVTVIGVTDSVKYPGTNSFQRFEYPSALPNTRLHELSELTEAIVIAHGLDNCFFNVEFLVPASGPVAIVEINPRIASQFAPLVDAVHGRSTYGALFALSCGDDPVWTVGDGQGVGVSYVLRAFEDAFVEAVPGPEAGLEILVRPGLRLSEQGTNDTASFRLAIFTQWAATRAEALRLCAARAESLPFRLTPLVAGRTR
jgi:hypothetical protein